jgi:hypothetical protein
LVTSGEFQLYPVSHKESLEHFNVPHQDKVILQQDVKDR